MNATTKPATFYLGDPEDKLSLAYAMKEGYTITLSDVDGEAEIVSPSGNVYHVHNFECDCPDAQGRKGGSYAKVNGERACKHVAWLSQMKPCDFCGSTMFLTEYRTAFGSRMRVFECEMCGDATAEDVVKQDRQAERRARRVVEEAGHVPV